MMYVVIIFFGVMIQIFGISMSLYMTTQPRNAVKTLKTQGLTHMNAFIFIWSTQNSEHIFSIYYWAKEDQQAILGSQYFDL